MELKLNRRRAENSRKREEERETNVQHFNQEYGSRMPGDTKVLDIFTTGNPERRKLYPDARPIEGLAERLAVLDPAIRNSFIGALAKIYFAERVAHPDIPAVLDTFRGKTDEEIHEQYSKIGLWQAHVLLGLIKVPDKDVPVNCKRGVQSGNVPAISA